MTTRGGAGRWRASWQCVASRAADRPGPRAKQSTTAPTSTTLSRTWTTVQAQLDTGRGKDDHSEEAPADLHGGGRVPELSRRGGGPRAGEQQVKRRGQA
ncbi:unnamed protein product [Miscanthus lutarioriparius]|uniref:Uncharacterized protein n=1 Tax=Miscanthus lutarioriparius TaxID=422564 RepID=A0A811N6H5_9POAL|nr:unnamed protein product [Miscanthus lutarioriparius]